ncbi:hypothetical protein [Actinomadura logoneensis]|nr:hypothetical protein [Actinomadura logoneensis]
MLEQGGGHLAANGLPHNPMMTGMVIAMIGLVFVSWLYGIFKKKR